MEEPTRGRDAGFSEAVLRAMASQKLFVSPEHTHTPASLSGPELTPGRVGLPRFGSGSWERVALPSDLPPPALQAPAAIPEPATTAARVAQSLGDRAPRDPVSLAEGASRSARAPQLSARPTPPPSAGGGQELEQHNGPATHRDPRGTPGSDRHFLGRILDTPSQLFTFTHRAAEHSPSRCGDAIRAGSPHTAGPDTVRQSAVESERHAVDEPLHPSEHPHTQPWTPHPAQPEAPAKVSATAASAPSEDQNRSQTHHNERREQSRDQHQPGPRVRASSPPPSPRVSAAPPDQVPASRWPPSVPTRTNDDHAAWPPHRGGGSGLVVPSVRADRAMDRRVCMYV